VSINRKNLQYYIDMRYTRKHRKLDRESRVAWITFRNKHDLPSTVLQWRQRGGGSVVTHGGYRYYVRESMDGDTLEIRGGGIPEKTFCFMVFINPDKTAVLHDVHRGDKCSLDGPEAPTGNMVYLAARLAKEHGAHTLDIHDMARVPVAPGSTTKCRLADVSLLTTGQSWYHKFLLLTSKDDEALAQFRVIIENNTWDNVYTCLLSKYRAVEVPAGATDGIDTAAPGSAKKVLTRIKYARTDFFAKYEAWLPQCSGVSSIYGWTWHCDLS
jgi:hypothetical protein